MKVSKGSLSKRLPRLLHQFGVSSDRRESGQGTLRVMTKEREQESMTKIWTPPNRVIEATHVLIQLFHGNVSCEPSYFIPGFAFTGPNQHCKLNDYLD